MVNGFAARGEGSAALCFCIVAQSPSTAAAANKIILLICLFLLNAPIDSLCKASHGTPAKQGSFHFPGLSPANRAGDFAPIAMHPPGCRSLDRG